MDFSFSPDLDAVWCYLIVFFVGLITAGRQFSARMDKLTPAAARRPSGWLLFAAYAMVPLVLFWSLDRTGAVRDTSVFAAVVVAAAYDRILAGGIGSLKVAPDAASTLWSPFVGWADRVADRIRDQVHRREQRLTDRAVAKIISDETKFKALEQLAATRSRDYPALRQRLQELDQAAGAAQALPKSVIQEQKARAVYDTIVGLPDYRFLLYHGGIIDKRFYRWHVLDWRGTAASIGAAVSVALILALLILFLATPPRRIQYYLWRLQKPNTTAPDRSRAGSYLANTLRTAAPADELALETSISKAMRWPELPAETVDRFLAILLAHRNPLSPAARIPGLMVDDLRVDNVDARVRVHSALLFLAHQHAPGGAACTCAATVKNLEGWNPSEGDAVTDLEGRIRQWESFCLHLSDLGKPTDPFRVKQTDPGTEPGPP